MHIGNLLVAEILYGVLTDCCLGNELKVIAMAVS